MAQDVLHLNQWVKRQLKIASAWALVAALFDNSDPWPPDLSLDRKHRKEPKEKIQRTTSAPKKRKSGSTAPAEELNSLTLYKTKQNKKLSFIRMKLIEQKGIHLLDF